MTAVQRGRDEESPQRVLDAAGQVDVAMLDEVRDRERDLEDQDRLDRCAQEHDGGESNRKREQQLPGVEANARRDGKGRVRMVDLMEAPEERNAMVRAMPAVRDGVQ